MNPPAGIEPKTPKHGAYIYLTTFTRADVRVNSVRQLQQATETGSAVYLNTFPRADVRVNSVRQLKQAATETGGN
jgi:hypothetical protein